MYLHEYVPSRLGEAKLGKPHPELPGAQREAVTCGDSGSAPSTGASEMRNFTMMGAGFTEVGCAIPPPLQPPPQLTLLQPAPLHTILQPAPLPLQKSC